MNVYAKISIIIIILILIIYKKNNKFTNCKDLNTEYDLEKIKQSHNNPEVKRLSVPEAKKYKLYEILNIEELRKFKDTIIEIENKRSDNECVPKLRDIINDIMILSLTKWKNDKYVKILVEYPLTYGRAYASPFSTQLFSQEERSILLNNLYLDIDIKGCWLNIIYYIAQVIEPVKYNKIFPALLFIIDNYDDIIDFSIKYYDTSRQVCKRLIIGPMFGYTLEDFEKEHNLTVLTRCHKFDSIMNEYFDNIEKIRNRCIRNLKGDKEWDGFFKFLKDENIGINETWSYISNKKGLIKVRGNWLVRKQENFIDKPYDIYDGDGEEEEECEEEEDECFDDYCQNININNPSSKVTIEMGCDECDKEGFKSSPSSEERFDNKILYFIGVIISQESVIMDKCINYILKKYGKETAIILLFDGFLIEKKKILNNIKENSIEGKGIISDFVNDLQNLIYNKTKMKIQFRSKEMSKHPLLMYKDPLDFPRNCEYMRPNVYRNKDVNFKSYSDQLHDHIKKIKPLNVKKIKTQNDIGYWKIY